MTTQNKEFITIAIIELILIISITVIGMCFYLIQYNSLIYNKKTNISDYNGQYLEQTKQITPIIPTATCNYTYEK